MNEGRWAVYKHRGTMEVCPGDEVLEGGAEGGGEDRRRSHMVQKEAGCGEMAEGLR